MKVSILGSRYGKETAMLLADACDRSIEVFWGVPKAQHADVWVLTDWDSHFPLDFKEKIRPQDIVLLNCDDARLMSYMAGLLCNTIPFGYHLKSTVTLSGRSEDVTTGQISYTFALQRPMLTCKGSLIEPCELRCVMPGGISLQSAMAAGTFFLVAEVAFFL